MEDWHREAADRSPARCRRGIRRRRPRTPSAGRSPRGTSRRTTGREGTGASAAIGAARTEDFTIIRATRAEWGILPQGAVHQSCSGGLNRIRAKLKRSKGGLERLEATTLVNPSPLDSPVRKQSQGENIGRWPPNRDTTSRDGTRRAKISRRHGLAFRLRDGGGTLSLNRHRSVDRAGIEPAT